MSDNVCEPWNLNKTSSTHISELDKAQFPQFGHTSVGRLALQEQLTQGHFRAPEKGPHFGDPLEQLRLNLGREKRSRDFIGLLYIRRTIQIHIRRPRPLSYLTQVKTASAA